MKQQLLGTETIIITTKSNFSTLFLQPETLGQDTISLTIRFLKRYSLSSFPEEI